MKELPAVDLETTSVEAEKGSVLSCGISDGVKTVAWSIKTPQDLQAAKEVLNGPCIVHSVPMEGSWSESFFGNDRHTKFIDTALLAFRVDPGEPKALASVVARHLPEYSGWKGGTEEQLADPDTGGSMLGVDEVSLLERNAVDACLTRRVYDKLWPMLTQEERDLHEEDVSIALFVHRMFQRGLQVSEEALIELRRSCVQTMSDEESWLRNQTGVGDLNPGSSQQLGRVFASRGIQLPLTDGGAPSVSGLALRVLRYESPDPRVKELVDHILKYRKAQDVLGDNVVSYAQARDPKDGRVRGGYWPGTVSWRPASPKMGRKDRINNLNVPREGVRQVFSCPPGYVFFEMDLSQAELRIMAQLSNDPVLVSGFRDGTDFHRRMGGRVYGKLDALETVTKQERYVGKKGNFSCGYFIGDDSLWESFAKEDIILPMETVQKLRQAFWFEEYVTLRKYSEAQRAAVRRGERLYAPTGGYHWDLQQASLIHPRNENEAVNSVYNWTIQSVPPRLVYRIGMLLERRVPESVLQITNSIYDSLMGYIREDCLTDTLREVRKAHSEVMAAEDRWLKEVSIPCDIKVGPNWQNLKEVKE